MSNVEDDKIMGFVPKDKYVLIAYYLILASAALGLLSTVLALISIITPLGALASIAGLIGLVMGLVGFFAFKDKFSSLDQSHLLYLCALFGIFFVIGLVLAPALAMIPILLFVVFLALGIAQVLLFFTGFNSYKHGRSVTKDNVKSEVQLAIKRA